MYAPLHYAPLGVYRDGPAELRHWTHAKKSSHQHEPEPRCAAEPCEGVAASVQREVKVLEQPETSLSDSGTQREREVQAHLKNFERNARLGTHSRLWW